MPFGSRPTRDILISIIVVSVLLKSHQCLSAVVPLGTSPSASRLSHLSRHQCLSAVVPLGTREKNRQHHIEKSVTNAFRQSSHSGPADPEFNKLCSLFGHQCLSAVVPLGTRKYTLPIRCGCLASPMPFGSRPTRDRRCILKGPILYISCHQCLSAVVPLGTPPFLTP